MWSPIGGTPIFCVSNLLWHDFFVDLDPEVAIILNALFIDKFLLDGVILRHHVLRGALIVGVDYCFKGVFGAFPFEVAGLLVFWDVLAALGDWFGDKDPLVVELLVLFWDQLGACSVAVGVYGELSGAERRRTTLLWGCRSDKQGKGWEGWEGFHFYY